MNSIIYFPIPDTSIETLRKYNDMAIDYVSENTGYAPWEIDDFIKGRTVEQILERMPNGARYGKGLYFSEGYIHYGYSLRHVIGMRNSSGPIRVDVVDLENVNEKFIGALI